MQESQEVATAASRQPALLRLFTTYGTEDIGCRAGDPEAVKPFWALLC